MGTGLRIAHLSWRKRVGLHREPDLLKERILAVAVSRSPARPPPARRSELESVAVTAENCPHWTLSGAAGFAGALIDLIEFDTCGLHQSGEDEAIDEWKIPGLAITVVQNGEVALVSAYGLSRRGGLTRIAAPSVLGDCASDDEALGSLLYALNRTLGDLRAGRLRAAQRHPRRPARATQAAAPLLFGLLMDHMGVGVLAISAGLSLSALLALLLLKTPQVSMSVAQVELRARSYVGCSGLLELLGKLAELALPLRAQAAKRDFLHPVGDSSYQQFAAEMRRGIGFVDSTPVLTKFAEVELGEARQRLLASRRVRIGRFMPAPAPRCGRPGRAPRGPKQG